MHRYGLDPTETHGVLVSHGHPDHWTDTAVLVEGITRGGLDRKGALVAPRSVLRGVPLPDGRTLGPVVSTFHQDMVANLHEAEPGKTFTLNGMYEVTPTKQDHSDPDTVGFRMRLTHGQVSYIPDTQYYDGLADEHKGSRLVVCQMTRGGSDRVPWHMCTDDVERLADQIRPRLLLLTHFGYKMLKEGDPGKWAQRITDRTGIATVAARDGMRITADRDFQIEMLGQPTPVALPLQ